MRCACRVEGGRTRKHQECDVDRFDGVMPGARVDTVVAAGQIGCGDLQIQRRLPQGLVLGEKDLFGPISVNLSKAGAFKDLP